MERVDPFPASDFCQWADSYDDVVGFDRFPFADYHKLLKSVLHAAAPGVGMAVLDIGTGTGNLARLFLEVGGRIVIVDNSFLSVAGMLEFAGTVGDLREGEPFWLGDEALRALRHVGFKCAYEQVSSCSGAYRVEPA